MSLERFRANEKLTSRIGAAIRAGKVFHAYMIEGDSLADKEGFALEFCKAILCAQKPGIGCDACASCRKIDHGNCEDLYVVEADGISVKDEQIEKLQAELQKKPLGPRNLAIIKDADTMTKRAQNRLLKTLEEPYEGTVIFLLSENRENLLDTIRSRCVIYRLEPDGRDREAGEAAEEIFAAVREGKSFFRRRELVSKYVKSREDAFALLDGLERLYGRLLIREAGLKDAYGEDVGAAVALIEEARRDLLFKVNYQYAIKNLMLKIGGQNG